MPDKVIEKEPAGRPRLGRPRRLELDQIVEAALAIGINKLTMQSVADHLGVGKPLLYGYVSSREELIRMAYSSANQKVWMPEDTGQPWATWVYRYSLALFDRLTTDGDLLEAWVEGGFQPSVDLGSFVMWIEVLKRHGFSGEDAVHLRLAVSFIVVGAAASNKHRRALRKTVGRSYDEGLREALARLPKQQSSLLSPFADLLGREIEPGSWEFSLYLLLQGVARNRSFLGKTSSDLPFTDLKPLLGQPSE